MKKLQVKAILSTLLILAVLILAATGAMLYFGKTGVVLGFSRGSLRDIHFVAAIIMCAMIAAHLALNLGLYIAGLRSLGKSGGAKRGGVTRDVAKRDGTQRGGATRDGATRDGTQRGGATRDGDD